MFDYLAWLNRAERFLRDLGHLPDQLHVGIDRGPPLGAEKLRATLSKSPVQIPGSLLDFYCTAGLCDLCYSWEPAPERLPLLKPIWRHQYCIYGSVRFRTPQEIVDQPWPLRDTGEWFRDEGEADESMVAAYTRSIGFIEVGNGDSVAFDGRCDAPEPPIIYLSHEEVSVDILSPNFETFLRDWETLCYIGPEIWLLREWVSPQRGTLKVTSPKAKRLRNLLIDPSRDEHSPAKGLR